MARTYLRSLDVAASRLFLNLSWLMVPDSLVQDPLRVDGMYRFE